MSTTGWIVLGVIVVFVLWIIMIYNRLVAMRQRVDQAFADVDVQLKQRHDLVPNLVETVKGYAAHERGTLEAVVQARNAAVAAQRPGASRRRRRTCCPARSGSCSRCREAYPDLKANQNFQQLQSELSDIENKIAASRRFFNNAVQEYNTGDPAVPGRAVRRGAGLQPAHVLRCRRGARRGRADAAGEILAESFTGRQERTMAAAYGLYTHIQSNKRRSIALLTGLFFLVYLMVYRGRAAGRGR